MNTEEYANRRREVAGNPFKFFEHVEITDANRGGIVPFEMWPHLKVLIAAYFKHRHVIVLKARQIGVSWASMAYLVWKGLFNPYSRFLLLSVTETDAALLLEKVRFIWSRLPVWLREDLELDNRLELKFKYTHSSFRALPSTEHAGSGEACSVVFPDEWAKQEFAEQNYAAIRPTIDAGSQFFGVSTIVKSNPEAFFNKMYKAARAGENDFYPLFFGALSRPDRDMDWYEEMKRGYSEEQLEEEYPLTEDEALSPLSAHSFFDKDALDFQWSRVRDPDSKRGPVAILQPPRVGTKYVAGVDVGGGVGENYSAMTILGVEGSECEVAAIVHTNKMAADLFAHEVAELGRQYFNCLIAVERNYLGLEVLSNLSKLDYPNIFYQDMEKPSLRAEMKTPGINTSWANRDEILQELRTAVRSHRVKTRYGPQVQEMFEFIMKPYKREHTQIFRPEGGKHDDLVMSLAIAYHITKFVPSSEQKIVISSTLSGAKRTI